MNAVEIEEAVSELARAPFDPDEFPYAFLAAFGNKETTLKKLRSTAKSSTNKSDLPGGVLQRNNIHLAVCEPGQVNHTLQALVASPATTKHKAKFVLVTDGQTIEAQNLADDAEPPLVCEFKELADHFGYLLPLAGITTVRQVRENAFDIKATSRLNRLYVELLRHNPDWDAADHREAMNHFFARLIFCFFAEDTGIFHGDGLFTNTVQQMTEPDASNVHTVLSEIFRAMDTPAADREAGNFRGSANTFPYVNGGLFAGSAEGGAAVPRFTKIARSYLLHIGSLDWTKINPDIFGSMIQAVADDEERGALGMHYTSVPNILKVLNPLFLDELNQKLEDAGDGSTPSSKGQLKRLRDRLARIRVFDPACGSGNFLVIAYKQMRRIEAEINRRRGEPNRRTDIPLTNFRGIELRHFAAEVARLALVIAEYQCDAEHRGPRLALQEFLPLSAENWITHGNALRLDWQSICPPTGTDVRYHGDDLFETPLNQTEMDFENEGGETYICGNPPYTGTRKQTAEQKSDLKALFEPYTTKWKNVDYVGAWFLKASQFNSTQRGPFAFVATNSLCQGQQVPITWQIILQMGMHINFAYTSFKWSNLASNKAGVTVVIAGIDKKAWAPRLLYSEGKQVAVDYINPYLTPHRVEIVEATGRPQFCEETLEYGVYYSKSAGLIVSPDEFRSMVAEGVPPDLFKQFIGSNEFISGKVRYCLWIPDDRKEEAFKYPSVAERINSVKRDRLATKDSSVKKLAAKPHQFREYKGHDRKKIFVPLVSSEERQYFPAGIAGGEVIPTNKACYAPDGPLWMLSMIVSRLHLVWIGTVCGRLETRFSYSNTLGWNTFPVPELSEANKAELTRRAEDILLAREAHFPATIAELYDPQKMPEDLRAAHDRNDETLERIYIGRRFRNDTERLEKLFELYTEMTVAEG